ncbi:hypothetical protein BJ912DRAFT_512334 [Pholiota molesta]|nr:hypothetical protein BJ912DRAFT_512334 [Pholiota molesta]
MKSLLLCFALSLTALCAGGMFTFPLMSPALAAHNKLSQPQLTSIILASGMMSQYPIAVVVGSLTDQYGPAMCILIGGLLFVAGFSGFSSEVQNTPTSILHSPQISFYRMCSVSTDWLGTVFSYCASLFAASKYFSNYIGLASGAMMAIFALSPLFFSSIATHFFMDSTTGLLDVVSFNTFLALVTGLVSVFVSVTLRQFPPPLIPEAESDTTTNDNIAHETTPLLNSDPEAAAIANGKPNYPKTIGELVKTVDFWLVAIYCVFILGASEMVISNIGTISESLPAAPYRSTLVRGSASSSSAALQVKLLSIANTVSRIIVGPLADFVSPIAGFLPSGIGHFLGNISSADSRSSLARLCCFR